MTKKMFGTFLGLSLVFFGLTYAFPIFVYLPAYTQIAYASSTCQAGMVGLYCSAGAMFILGILLLLLLSSYFFLTVKLCKPLSKKTIALIIALTIFGMQFVYAVSVSSDVFTMNFAQYIFIAFLLQMGNFVILSLSKPKSMLLRLSIAILLLIIVIGVVYAKKEFVNSSLQRQSQREVASLTMVHDPNIFVRSFTPVPAMRYTVTNSEYGFLVASPYYPYILTDDFMRNDPEGGDEPCSISKELVVDQTVKVFWIALSSCNSNFEPEYYGPYRYPSSYVFD